MFLVENELGLNELWITNLDGSGEHRLLPAPVTSFSWSPDGRYIGVIHKDRMWLLTPDQRDPARVLAESEVLLLPEFSSFRWSPDSQWLSVSNQRGLWLVSRDGQTVRLLIDNIAPHQFFVSYAWSPDSKQLLVAEALAIVDQPYDATLSLIDIRTGKTRLIKEVLQSHLRGGIWSPDGKLIALNHEMGFQIISSNGQREGVLPTDSKCFGFFVRASWSATEPWLAAAFSGNGRQAQRYACVSSMQEVIPLQVGGNSSEPIWDKSGKYVYLVVSNMNPDQPDLDPDTRLMRFDVQTRRMERLRSLSKDPRGVGTVALSPDGQYLSHLKLAGGGLSFLEVIDLRDLSQLEYHLDLHLLNATRGEYTWTPDGRSIVFRDELDYDIGTAGNILYRLDILTRQLTPISCKCEIGAWAVVPIMPGR